MEAGGLKIAAMKTGRVAAGVFAVVAVLAARLVAGDRVSKVTIYVATTDPGLRARLETRRADLIRYEQSFQLDPARNDADFAALDAFLPPQ